MTKGTVLIAILITMAALIVGAGVVKQVWPAEH